MVWRINPSTAYGGAPPFRAREAHRTYDVQKVLWQSAKKIKPPRGGFTYLQNLQSSILKNRHVLRNRRNSFRHLTKIL